mmetsp:Transcript_66727/g.139303  ORF Transcript_66727/g.139303 Transcript_66727/m.139303 type:complete len:94 (-) Transcript_66727:115-396(-)
MSKPLIAWDVDDVVRKSSELGAGLDQATSYQLGPPKSWNIGRASGLGWQQASAEAAAQRAEFKIGGWGSSKARPTDAWKLGKAKFPRKSWQVR